MGNASLRLIKGQNLDILLETEIMIEKGGPTIEDDTMIRAVADVIDKADEKTKAHFYKILKPILTLDTLLGFTFLKPHGYAGDFQLVDFVHTNHITDIEHLKAWDYMYQQLSASVALRNRKAYFNNFIDAEYKNKKSLSVLNIGSGPCRDVKEFFDQRPDVDIQIDCIDMDFNSIAYAKELCHDHTSKIRFMNENALRYRSDKKYDVVWSAGMFDYFKDKLFIALMKRYFKFLKPGGVLALGNINITNPHRIAMEVYGQWYLHHRSHDDLVRLVDESKTQHSDLSISCEETTVNIFAHLRN